MTNGLKIERLVVDGGFLDGLDLSFSDGLNVLIGERGSGKTSVIELLRFAFGSQPLTERFARQAREHSASVLGDGRVSVSYLQNGERRSVSRRVGDDRPEGQPPAARYAPIVLSQNEIEAVGLDGRGRLRLLDGFRVDRPESEQPSVEHVASLAAEVRGLEAEISELREQLPDVDALRAELARANAELAASMETSAQFSADLEQIDKIGDQLAQLGALVATRGAVQRELKRWEAQLEASLETAPLGSSLRPAVEPDIHSEIRAAIDQVRSAISSVQRAEKAVTERAHRDERRKADLEESARRLRVSAERTQQGIGKSARAASNTKEQLAQRDLLAARIDALTETLERRRGDLSNHLRELERLQSARFEDRKGIAASITRALGPHVSVSVERGAQIDDYSAGIAEVLRGSGLKYGQIAPALAIAMSPVELVDAIHASNSHRVADAAGVSLERAQRLVAALHAADLAPLLRSPREDSVVMKLLDGAQQKPTPMLSTGQRCTVVLPILLLHDERPIVMDQPEDHLDNAYVVETLVRAIRAKRSGSQLLVATHNPNVPVLGGAERVIQMGSDGRRGFERLSGSLLEPHVVDAITLIMEGGADAFRRRAAFYSGSG